MRAAQDRMEARTLPLPCPSPFSPGLELREVIPGTFLPHPQKRSPLGPT